MNSGAGGVGGRRGVFPGLRCTGGSGGLVARARLPLGEEPPSPHPPLLLFQPMWPEIPPHCLQEGGVRNGREGALPTALLSRPLVRPRWVRDPGAITGPGRARRSAPAGPTGPGRRWQAFASRPAEGSTQHGAALTHCPTTASARPASRTRVGTLTGPAEASTHTDGLAGPSGPS